MGWARAESVSVIAPTSLTCRVCVSVQRCVYWEGKLFPLPSKLEDAPFFQVCPPCAALLLRPPCVPFLLSMSVLVCVRPACWRACQPSAGASALLACWRGAS